MVDIGGYRAAPSPWGGCGVNWVGTALGEGALRAADGIRVDVAVLYAARRAVQVFDGSVCRGFGRTVLR